MGKMNFRGFAFLMALLIAVQLTTFAWAAQNLTKTSGKDNDEQGKHLGEQPVLRMVQACTPRDFSLGRHAPTFPVPNHVTFSICQDNHYATFYDNTWGIARYAVYKITAEQATAARVPRHGDPWQPTQRPGTVQGSDALFQDQPKPPLYDRGHIVPFGILAYSDESTFATFTYTNCVPQNKNFNRGQWKKYEMKILKYARDYCSPNGGTLYLITGTSQVQFKEKRNPQGEIIGVDKSVPDVEWFHDNVDTDPTLGPKIAIPNSMWTVGCCQNDKKEVVGAFGVMGNNFFDPDLNKFMMSRQNVKYVEDVLRSENQDIELFPGGKGCYDMKKNVPLNDLKSYHVP